VDFGRGGDEGGQADAVALFESGCCRTEALGAGQREERQRSSLVKTSGFFLLTDDFLSWTIEDTTIRRILTITFIDIMSDNFFKHYNTVYCYLRSLHGTEFSLLDVTTYIQDSAAHRCIIFVLVQTLTVFVLFGYYISSYVTLTSSSLL